jgi:hypothetical protein
MEDPKIPFVRNSWASNLGKIRRPGIGRNGNWNPIFYRRLVRRSNGLVFALPGFTSSSAMKKMSPELFSKRLKQAGIRPLWSADTVSQV